MLRKCFLLWKGGRDAEMLYFHCWSGGKDSTASVILDHVHGLPPSKIIFSEVMFDKKRGISGELPEHIDFVMNKAKPLFESWGYTVEIVRAEKDYMTLFNQVIEKSTKPERIGKKYGFLLGGRCSANRNLKINPIRDFYKRLGLAGNEYTQYVGIAIDEPIRLERLRGTNKVSLLETFGYTEQAAYDLCKEWGLLSPIYGISRRGGCWFCPSQSYKQIAWLKRTHSDLWEELRRLSEEPETVSTRFKYEDSFADADRKADAINARLQQEAAQITLFDLL